MERTCLPSAHGGADILILRILITALVLIGCSTPSDTLPYPLLISEEGLGAIHPDTPFEQISTSLSGFEFEKLSQISPQESEILFQIKRGNTAMAHIVSDSSGKKIASIHILSPLIKNKNNQGLGDLLLQTKTLKCADNLCHYPEEPSLLYRIDSKSRTIREITYQKL
ncbi:MAG: hypothetical protein Q8M43_07295 [Sulfuricurvum sp.]|uniref:hypothetical protein n=1 Tax=Sulfuricurvum sp. TaxID=2025608 RepID=UPI00273481AA|nr:hypothetical protein [Sulfuricurvum sp.]MDP3291821.1 hypothetical protein [Sulfuricurvum sp.]